MKISSFFVPVRPWISVRGDKWGVRVRRRDNRRGGIFRCFERGAKPPKAHAGSIFNDGLLGGCDVACRRIRLPNVRGDRQRQNRRISPAGARRRSDRCGAAREDKHEGFEEDFCGADNLFGGENDIELKVGACE